VRFPGPPVLGFENWGPRFPARHPTEGTSQADQSGLKFVLPAMLAKGFGSDRRNRCAKCAGVPRPIIARKSGGMCGTRELWNKGRLIGQKRPLKSKDVWTIRERLQLEGERILASRQFREICKGSG